MPLPDYVLAGKSPREGPQQSSMKQLGPRNVTFICSIFTHGFFPRSSLETMSCCRTFSAGAERHAAKTLRKYSYAIPYGTCCGG